MSDMLLSAVSYNIIRSQQIASTLKYFMELAMDSWGVILGVDENQLALQEKKNALRDRLFVKEAIDRGYSVRGGVKGENALFPADIFLV